MKITYIAHSGFLVETERCLLLFDYYRGDLPALPADKPLYVFASHRHEDHFNPRIFDLGREREDVSYILAFDIRLTDRNLRSWGIGRDWLGRILTARAHETYDLAENLKIETLKSTDEGVAFLVTADGHAILHAGDLNWWYWEGEDAGWLGTMTADFQREVERIAGREIEAAFLPLDDRLGKDFYLGMDWYLRSLKVKYAFPMHFWDDRSVIERFEALPCRKDYDTVICDTARENVWEI